MSYGIGLFILLVGGFEALGVYVLILFIARLF